MKQAKHMKRATRNNRQFVKAYLKSKTRKF